MNDNITKIVDVIHGTIYLSELEKEIISTPLFNRLHYISQTIQKDLIIVLEL